MVIEREANPGELCTCGRDAVTVYSFSGRGEMGWCGLSSALPPVVPCRFCGSDEAHRTAWGDLEKCPRYQLVPAGEMEK